MWKAEYILFKYILFQIIKTTLKNVIWTRSLVCELGVCEGEAAHKQCFWSSTDREYMKPWVGLHINGSNIFNICYYNTNVDISWRVSKTFNMYVCIFLQAKEKHFSQFSNLFRLGCDEKEDMRHLYKYTLFKAYKTRKEQVMHIPSGIYDLIWRSFITNGSS